MAKTPKPERQPRTYRLPADLVEGLELLTERTRRTVTAELEIAIEKHLLAEDCAPARIKPAKPPK